MDSQGNNITRKVTQKFIISKVTNWTRILWFFIINIPSHFYSNKNRQILIDRFLFPPRGLPQETTHIRRFPIDLHDVQTPLHAPVTRLIQFLKTWGSVVPLVHVVNILGGAGVEPLANTFLARLSIFKFVGVYWERIRIVDLRLVLILFNQPPIFDKIIFITFSY